MLNSGKSLESLAPTVTEVRQLASRLRPRHWLPRVSSRKCVGVRVSRSAVSDPETPWTAACQAPLSMGLSRQERWSGCPFPVSASAFSVFYIAYHSERFINGF